MKNDEKKILMSLGDIDEKYLDQARPKRNKVQIGKIMTIAASLVLTFSLSLWVLLSGMLDQGGATLSPDGENEPPSISNDENPDSRPEEPSPNPGGEASNPSHEPPSHSKSLASAMNDFLLSDRGNDEYSEDDGFVGGDSAPGDTGEGSVGGGSNGSYVEVTDNQIEGIIEGDLYKTTDKYIFRYRMGALYIYSIDGENSAQMSSVKIVDNSKANGADMFLSADGNTITVIRQEFVRDSVNNDEMIYYYGHYVTTVYSIDVSDVKNPEIKKTLEINGSISEARKIGDKIYLVTSVSFRKGDINIDDASTYIPSITEGEKIHLCDLERICYPEEITNASYIYVTVFSESDLSLESEYAVLSEYNAYSQRIYFTDNHIVIEHQGGKKISEEEATSEAYSWIELIDFSGEELRYRGSIEMRGWAESGQYSYDEQDGYLRVVASTRMWKRYRIGKASASLYIYNLSDMTLAASVDDFAPDGERATAVRFEGDKLYVCTAETQKYTDPVFFFDLSDYSNITQVNTGYIEGFSTSLIDLGEGYLLGIGRESTKESKIEVYKREGDTVVSVAEYIFRGGYDSDYHAYLIDRENNLFGLAINYLYEGYGVTYGFGYFLWQFDQETESIRLITEISSTTEHTCFNRARSFVRDGYLYLTSTNNYTPLVVKKIDIK